MKLYEKQQDGSKIEITCSNCGGCDYAYMIVDDDINDTGVVYECALCGEYTDNTNLEEES